MGKILGTVVLFAAIILSTGYFYRQGWIFRDKFFPAVQGNTKLTKLERIDRPSVCPSSLRILAENHNLLIGSAVSVEKLREDPSYSQKLACEFNILTPENDMKFEYLEPKRGSFNFSDADEIVNFAEDNDMQVRGHTLVWHESLPKWLTKKKWKRRELKKILRNHIHQVVGHYKGRVQIWDVVNEAVSWNGKMRKTIWYKGLGPGYVDMAFRFAREADPNAKLFYNDYQTEGAGKKSDAVYRLVKKLKDKGVPIDGVGLQMHASLGGEIFASPPDMEEVKNNMERLKNLGLEVNITELDVAIQDGTGSREERLNEQAEVYGNALSACLSKTNCKVFTVWGFTDKYSWVKDETGDSSEAPDIFDENFNPKPAHSRLQEMLSEP